MRYGIVTANLGDYADPRVAVRLARTAEAAGWEAFFVWDHLGFVRGVPSGVDRPAPHRGQLKQSGREMRLDKQDHRSLVLWATECAEHVLPYFEQNYPKDNRPRNALEAGRAWVRGEIAVSEAYAQSPEVPDPEHQRDRPSRLSSLVEGHILGDELHHRLGEPHRPDHHADRDYGERQPVHDIFWRCEHVQQREVGGEAERARPDPPPAAQAPPESRRRLSDEPLKRPITVGPKRGVLQGRSSLVRALG